jgi:hypothetical protein
MYPAAEILAASVATLGSGFGNSVEPLVAVYPEIVEGSHTLSFKTIWSIKFELVILTIVKPG